MVGRNELERRFTYHQPDEVKKALHEKVRVAAYDFAEMIDELPGGREQSFALTKIEEAMFWTNAAIARSE